MWGGGALKGGGAYALNSDLVTAVVQLLHTLSHLLLVEGDKLLLLPQLLHQQDQVLVHDVMENTVSSLQKLA